MAAQTLQARESARIEHLISSAANLKDAEFIRNRNKYDKAKSRS